MYSLIVNVIIDHVMHRMMIRVCENKTLCVPCLGRGESHPTYSLILGRLSLLFVCVLCCQDLLIHAVSSHFLCRLNAEYFSIGKIQFRSFFHRGVFKKGHISRFCFVFQIILVISSNFFAVRKKRISARTQERTPPARCVSHTQKERVVHTIKVTFAQCFL